MQRLIFCLTLLISAFGSFQAALSEPSVGTSGNTELGLLEQKYFEHRYDSDAVDVRVGRLEKMIYGDTRQGSTASRLASIVSLVEKEEEQPLVPVSPPAPSAASNPGTARPRIAAAPPRSNSANSPANNSNAADRSQAPAPSVENGDFANYPHITALEDEILGHAFPQDAISARLARLETAVFGKSMSSQDLSTRTDALEQFAETKLHKKPFGINPKMGDGDAPVVIENTPEPQEPVYRRAADGENQSLESPEVLANNPPGSGAKMITRVAWCEYHVFGKTFPALHLIARLRQLHDELAPSRQESNFQLMDDMDSLTQAVLTHIQNKK